MPKLASHLATRCQCYLTITQLHYLQLAVNTFTWWGFVILTCFFYKQLCLIGLSSRILMLILNVWVTTMNVCLTNCECCLHHFISIRYCSKMMSLSLDFYQTCSIWINRTACSILHKIEHFRALYRLYLKIITIEHRAWKWLNLYKLP